jgi:regulator of sigma E protease
LDLVITILVTILIFGVLIFIHELGHFLVAKACKVKVNEFAMGMGPTLIKWQGKETKYALRAFPIGGFVSMEGEDESSGEKNAFCNKPIWQRILVVITGPLMNMLLGFIILIVVVAMTPLNGSNVIARFNDGAVSNQEGGLQVGDELLSINGNSILVDTDIVYSLLRAKDGIADIDVMRNGEFLHLEDVQFRTVETDGKPQIDIDFKVKAIEKDIFSVSKMAFNKTLSYAKTIWVSFLDMVTGNVGINELSGPIGAGQVIGQTIQLGLSSVLNIAAFISINVGIFNLFPFPALDGWRFFVLIIEGIRRKPINRKYESIINLAGLALLMGLMLFVTFNDVFRLFQG